MKKNLSPKNRIIRAFLAIVIATVLLLVKEYIALIIPGVILLTAITGFCPLYKICPLSKSCPIK